MKNFFRRPQVKKVQQISQLRAIISEETKRILREAEEEINEEKGEDSLDAQVDKYLSDYEAEAKNLKREGRDFRSLVRRFLREAPEDEDEEKEDEDAEDEGGDEEGDEEGGGDEGGEDEEEKDEEPKKLTLDDVNVESFADSVVRLVDNYDSLLEVRNTILRRAINFLAKTYDIDVVDSFKEVVQERHGIEIGKSKSEMEEEDFQPPAAARAGTSPGA